MATIQRGWQTGNKIEELKNLLGEIRIKYGVDYCLTYKFNKVHVLCDRVWKQSIEEVAAQVELEIFEWHFYN